MRVPNGHGQRPMYPTMRVIDLLYSSGLGRSIKMLCNPDSELEIKSPCPKPLYGDVVFKAPLWVGLFTDTAGYHHLPIENSISPICGPDPCPSHQQIHLIGLQRPPAGKPL